MNMEHFGEIHYWNGEEIECVPDDYEALKRKNNNVNDTFPEDRPEPNTQIVFDMVTMKVLDIHDNKGMYDILLTAFDPRELI